MNNKQFSRPALLLAMALAFAACSNEDIQVDNPTPDPKPTEGKMTVSITGTINDEGRDTRSSFVYGESLENGGIEGEKFQWNAKDKINLRFSEQSSLDFSQNVLFAPADLKEGQNATSFSGEITKHTGKQTIYAVSRYVQIGASTMDGPVGTLVRVDYPTHVTQKGKDLSHLGETDYMWARVEDFNMDADDENPLKGLNLDFEHLGAMLRFQIKNTSKDNQYTLQSVTVKEEGDEDSKILWDKVEFDLIDKIPTLKKGKSSGSKPKTVIVEGADQMGQNDTFDAYMMVSGSPAGTDLTKVSGYRFVVEVVVKDKDGKELRKEIKIDPTVANGEFLKNGFEAGFRYYFAISVDENELKDYYTVINVKTAGTLNTLVVDANTERLKVTGKIDQRDFEFMNNDLLNLYDLDLSEATIEKYKAGDVTYEAHTIPENAFYNKASLKYITLPHNTIAIGYAAFKECSGFTGPLTIPASVETIGNEAFSNCDNLIGNLTIPASVKTIGVSAFTSCSSFTGDLSIPNNVEKIGDVAFSGCYGFDGKLTLPKNEKFKIIGLYAFFSCTGFIGDLSIPEGVETIGENAFTSCSGFTGDLSIPASVTSIGIGAFYDTNFSKVDLYWGTEPTILKYDVSWWLPDVKTVVPNGMEQDYKDKKWKNVVERD